jgi:hypothetical protein
MIHHLCHIILSCGILILLCRILIFWWFTWMSNRCKFSTFHWIWIWRFFISSCILSFIKSILKCLLEVFWIHHQTIYWWNNRFSFSMFKVIFPFWWLLPVVHHTFIIAWLWRQISLYNIPAWLRQFFELILSQLSRRIHFSQTSTFCSWISFDSFWSLIYSTWDLSLDWFIFILLCLSLSIISYMDVFCLNVIIEIIWHHLLDVKHFWSLRLRYASINGWYEAWWSWIWIIVVRSLLG